MIQAVVIDAGNIKRNERASTARPRRESNEKQDTQNAMTHHSPVRRPADGAAQLLHCMLLHRAQRCHRAPCGRAQRMRCCTDRSTTRLQHYNEPEVVTWGDKVWHSPSR